MSLKRKAPKTGRSEKASKRVAIAAAAAAAAAASFEAWFDDAMQLKESGDFSTFEEELLKKCNDSRVDVDDCARCSYELALLFCQQGLCEKADPLLSQLGFKYRLGKKIWNFDTAPVLHTSTVPDTLACYDNVLPEIFLSRLRDALAPDSSFWVEHEYPTDAFFSYNSKLPSTVSKGKNKKAEKKGSGDANNLIAQVAEYLKPLVMASFPGKFHSNTIDSVEWWAHTRPNGSAAGHRLHYDLDETRLRNEDGQTGVTDASIHPFVSSVLYLDDGGASGAPTVLFNHKLSGAEEDEAWIVQPATSRLLLFDGSLLHGVPPHIRGATEASSGTRLTLMIGWWGSSVHTMSHQPGEYLGPNMTMPKPVATSRLSWPRLFCPVPSDDLEPPLLIENATRPTAAIRHIDGKVWDPIKIKSSKKSGSVGCLQTNNVLFVGNWFLKSKEELNDEILNSSADSMNGPKGVGSVTQAIASSEVGWLSIEDLMKLRGDA